MKIDFPHLKKYFFTYKTVIILTVLYSIGIIFLSQHHEVWRDEIRPMSYVMESQTYGDLFVNMKNDGHPALWHTILYVLFNIFHTTAVVKIAHIIIAILAIVVFLLHAPFSKIHKALFVFGYFPMYEYAVINRNYGLSMLFLFLFCALYKERSKRILLISIILFLLAVSNIYSAIIVFAITLALATEYILSKKFQNLKMAITSFIIMVSGVSLSIYQSYPEQSVIYTKFHSLGIFEISFASAKAILSPAASSYLIFGIPSLLIITIGIYLTYIYLIRKPYLLAIFFVSVTGLQLFFSIIYQPSIRHQGLIFLLFVVIFWLDQVTEVQSEKMKKPFRNFNNVISSSSIILTIFLVLQVTLGIRAFYTEYTTEYSSSKALSQYIDSHPQYKDAIIMGEPDFHIEALPYYIDNPIYVAREAQFTNIVHLTDINKRSFTLDQLMDTGIQLQESHQKPVLIAMGHILDKEISTRIQFSYFGESVFSYTPKSYKRFEQQTEKLATFRDARSDENYDLYLLK